MQSSTIQDLRDTYLVGNKRIKWSTAQLTDRAFSYLLRAIGNMELKYMKMEHAEEFQLWLLNRFSKTSCNIYMKIIRPVFRFAIRRHWMKEDVFAIPLIKVTEERERIYDSQEVRHILEATNQIWRLRIMLGVFCGLRRAEALNITFSDLDFQRKLIHIQPKKETQQTWAWEPKGKTCRTLPMPEELEGLIQAQREDLPNGQPYVCISEIRYWRLTQLLKKGQLSERVRLCPDENFSKPFKLVLGRANVSDGTYHDLRRTYGTNMAEAGIPQHELAYLMGHNDPKTTARFYIKIRQGHTIERARVLTNSQAIGAIGYEPTTSSSPNWRSNQAELRPEQTILSNIT